MAILRPFEHLRARIAQDAAQTVDLFLCIGPEGEAIRVPTVAQLLVHLNERLDLWSPGTE